MSATMQRLVLAMLAAPCAAMRLAPMAPRLATRAGVVSMAENRFSEKILDNSLPDPVYDEMGGDGGYLGKSNVGFSQGAETWNGRAAMMGFTIAYLQEAITGKGILTLYGLPYDQGAVVESGGFNLFIGIGGFIGALILTTVLAYGGNSLYKKLDPKYDGVKLPFEDKIPF